MQTLAKHVLEHAAGFPEGTPFAAKELLHLGCRAAVDQVLSRLVQRVLAWLGPEKAGEASQKLRAKLPQSTPMEVASARQRLPQWLAQEVSTLATQG